MKVTLSMAMSLNGMIADKDGSEDFLSHDHWNVFTKLANTIGSNIWGRKTYESVKLWGGDYLKDITDVRKIVISRDQSIQLDSGFTLADSPKDALAILEQEGKHEALVTGGPTINSAFIKQGLVDEVILTIEPAFMGQGITLLSSEDFVIPLRLLSIARVTQDILQLHYEVIK